MLGHEAFKDDLVLQPYRRYTAGDDTERVYTEMASADWWWETQEKLDVDNGTIVPLIIASDKTLVTNTGNQKAYPIYLTIGNLPASIRNSNVRPRAVSLGMLLRGVEKASPGERWDIVCGDGLLRRCFPVGAAMTIDHEEQAVMADTNNKSRCPLCTIPPDEREDLQSVAPWRNHADMRSRVRAQRKRDKEKAGNPRQHRTPEQLDLDERLLAGRVHSNHNFGCKHSLTNVYRCFMMDILHQLLSGVIAHTKSWVDKLLVLEMPLQQPKRYKDVLQDLVFQSRFDEKRKRANVAGKGHVVRETSRGESAVKAVLDRRWAAVPKYMDLRVFKEISKIAVWTGKEWKSVLRTMLPVYVPLLDDIGATDAIRFLRALVDFSIYAMYRSHDNDTLDYMSYALIRTNEYKKAFSGLRMAKRREEDDEEGSESHFNFPKWHAITHYVEMIKWLGNAADLETGHAEHWHRRFVKTAYCLTKKKEGWEGHIMEQSKRTINVEAELERPFGRSGLPAVTANRVDDGVDDLVRPSGQNDPTTFFSWPRRERHPRRKQKGGWTIDDVLDCIAGPARHRFRQVIAVFVRESRTRTADPDKLEADTDKFNDMKISFHSGIKCRERTGKDAEDPDFAAQEIVRCAPNRQGQQGRGRYDCLWVQEWEMGEKRTRDNVAEMAFCGRLPARLKFVVAIPDDEHYDENGDPNVCEGVLVGLYEPCDRDKKGRALQTKFTV